MGTAEAICAHVDLRFISIVRRCRAATLMIGLVACSAPIRPGMAEAATAVPVVSSAIDTLPCPSEEMLRAAARADSVKRAAHSLPPHAYVSYILDGRIVAANVSGVDAARAWGGSPPKPLVPALDTLDRKSIESVAYYPAGSVPGQYNICPGVSAVVIQTKGGASR